MRWDALAPTITTQFCYYFATIVLDGLGIRNKIGRYQSEKQRFYKRFLANINSPRMANRLSFVRWHGTLAMPCRSNLLKRLANPLWREQMSDSKYKMSLSLNVLNHLGLNLYSNTPAVLSEVIANAWDADATEVKVDFNLEGKTITVSDDGHGMDLDDINDKYLFVGYQKRNKPDFRTPGGRRDRWVEKALGNCPCSPSRTKSLSIVTKKVVRKNLF